MNTIHALIAKSLLPMEGEKKARGSALEAPLKKIDNAAVLVSNGQILAYGKKNKIRVSKSCQCHDMGDVCLIPAVFNCHSHLDLSLLEKKTLWHAGFTAWLKSLIPILPRGQYAKEEQDEACRKIIADLKRYGTRMVGNIAGSAPDSLKGLQQYARESGITLTNFCEWFGFDETCLPAFSENPWPPRVSTDLKDTSLALLSAPAGHALYSTSPNLLRAASRFCREKGRIFTFHLAESPEETELLTEGRGSLYELYKDVVLPPTWKAPRMRPLAFANHLGLLHSNTLAVHGTQLDRQEAQILAANGTMLCLCPRSNANLGVGLPDVHGLMEENVLLCLGTDGLSSNTDVDVCNEALFLRKKMDISPNALIRMLTVNGASALGDAHGGKLSGRASFCALPDELIHGCTFA